MGLSSSNPPLIYKAKGCVHCNHTGYRGRTGIYELIVIDEEIRRLIHSNASEQAMEDHARLSGPSIRQDGIRNVLSGVTTLEEVLRVTREG
jgi:general secretion pathway protein E